MLLERMDPFLAEFDRLTQRTFGGAHGVGLPMDVIRREDELIVTVDLPGVPSDGITIDLENHVLTISAERHATYGENDTVLVQERFDGALSRRIRVPDWVDSDNVSASHVDGVLTVRLPLADRAKPRRIAVSATSAPDIKAADAPEELTA
jgi:HSP20 family protein